MKEMNISSFCGCESKANTNSLQIKRVATFIIISYLTFLCLFLFITKHERVHFTNSTRNESRFETDISTSLSNNSVRPACTLSFLKQYAIEHHSYSRFPFTQIGKKAKVAPSGNYSCWFPDSQMSQSLTFRDKCIDVSRILLLGDSNGRRYTDAMISAIKASGWSCKTTKVGHQTNAYLPDPKYFVREPMIKLDHIQFHSRDCHSCTSVMFECSRSSGQRLTVEYLSVQYLLDSEITSVRNGKMCEGRTTCDQSDTHQEFIFREYLADRYPDVLFYFLNSHDLGRHSLKRIKISADYFFNIVDSYMPSTSRVILLSSMKRLLQKDPRKVSYEDNLNSNEKQLIINRMVYESADSRLKDENKQWYAFPDLYDVSKITDHMYSDHVHRTPVWYQHITRYLLQLICF